MLYNLYFVVLIFRATIKVTIKFLRRFLNGQNGDILNDVLKISLNKKKVFLLTLSSDTHAAI